ncbi:hypothetical protein ACJMK2_010799 [Sinanodonta woodiana]|uniref:Exophilin 5 n=1 Tax=Sinanodonta woodiana TaxID=1069815 RepID=A0ABD3VGJ7_SINWO
MQVISPKRDKACPLIDITLEASDTTFTSNIDKDSDTLQDSCSRNTSTPPSSNKTFSCSTLGKNADAVVVPPYPAPPSAAACHEEQHSVLDLSQFLSNVSRDDPNEMVKLLMQTLKSKSIRGISKKEKSIEKSSDNQLSHEQKPTLPGGGMHDKQKLHQQQYIQDFERQIDEQIFRKPNAPLPTIKSIDKKSQIPKQIKPLEKSTNEKSFHQIKPPKDKDPVQISEKSSSKQQITEQHSQKPSEKRTNIPSIHSSERTAASAKEVVNMQRKTSEWKSPKLSIASYKELELKTSQRTSGSRSQPDSGDMKCSTLLPDRKSEKYKTDGCVATPDSNILVDKALDVLDSKCNDSDLTRKQQRNSKCDLKLSNYEVLHEAQFQLPEPSRSPETQYYKSCKEDKNDLIAIQVR